MGSIILSFVSGALIYISLKALLLIRLTIWLLSSAFFLHANLSSAQFTDNFSDGDFTNNPTWNGTADFIINASSQLQLNNSVAGTSRLSSSFVAPTLNNMEWQVYVKQTFASSGSNYGRVYLVSDQANLSGPLNGYYLQFGEAGSLDAVELFRQTGLVSTSVCRATNGSIANSFTVRVRVLRSPTGLWKLMTDYTGGTNFIQEASGTDATYNSSLALGVVCVYTASNANKFFYDDFFMGPEVVDITPPMISSVTPLSGTTLDVVFNEKVDATSAQLVSNFSVNNGVGSPLSSILQTDEKTVRLNFVQQFPNALTCQLTISGVKDLFNNAIAQVNGDFLFFQPVPAELNDIILTEIFADPSPTVGLPELEFVEIYNRSNKIFDLQNWKITDGSSLGALSSHLFFPNQYIILTSAASVSQFTSYGTVLGISNFPTLNNAGDQLTLKDNNDFEVNHVSYAIEWYQDDDKKQGGYTLELIDPGNRCAAESNWKASVSATGGTPGTQNSVFAINQDLTGPKLISATPTSATEIIIQFDEKLRNQPPAVTDFSITPLVGVSQLSFTDGSLTTLQLTLSSNLQPRIAYTISAQNIYDCPGNITEQDGNTIGFGLPELASDLDVIVTEIFSNPAPTVGLPEFEFIEIYNRSDKVLDLRNWKITDGSSTGTLPPHLFFPNEYIILTSAASVSQFSSYGTVLGIPNFPTLNNSGDQLSLRDNSDVEINQISYTMDWYRDDDKKQGGYTLELIDVNDKCAGENNWIASASATGGTPGTQNSVFANNLDVAGPKLTSIIVASPTEIIIQFDEKLRKQLPATTDFLILPLVEVSNVSFTDGSLKTLQLTLSSGLRPRVTYAISVQNVYDCPGNVVGNRNSLVFGLPESADRLDVLINEIFSNPSPAIGLPEFEFIELYNRSDKILDLKNWQITDGSSTGSLPQHLFFPNEYIVLTSVSAAPQFAGFGTVVSVADFPALNNVGETVVLKDSVDLEIDKIHYTDDWYRDDDKKDGGYSLERIDPTNICAEETNWTSSEAAAGGTPGTQNSVFANRPDLTGPKLISAIPTSSMEIEIQFDEKLQEQLPDATDFSITPPIEVSEVLFKNSSLKTLQLMMSANLESGVQYSISVQNIYDCPGNIISSDNTFVFGLPEEADSADLLINEILFNPRPTGIDFVEIYNNSTKYINLKNWSIANYENGELSNLSPISKTDYLLPPDRYIVFTEDAHVVKGEYVLAVEENLFTLKNLPPFNDDNGTVALVDSLQNIIDFLAYEDHYHSVFIDDDEGVSLERISFSTPSNEPGNWQSASSTLGFATPGFVNSNVRGEPAAGQIVVSPEIFEPISGQPGFTQIQYDFDQGGSVANVKILDSHGREIKQIVSNAILGTQGFFRWDGDTNDGTKARTGYYVVWIEVFDANGLLKTFRKRVVIATSKH